jgi:hypothetical protein
MQLGKLFAIFLENLVIVKSPSYANYQTETQEKEIKKKLNKQSKNKNKKQKN